MILAYHTGQEVEVVFDETAHSYTVAHKLMDGTFSDPRPTHGVTAPLAVVPKDYLTPWGAKMGVEALLEHLVTQPLTAEQLEQFFIDKQAMDDNERTADNKPVMSSYRFAKLYPWFAKAKSAYKRKAQDGKDAGHWLHKAIENFYNSGRKELPQLNEEVQPMWDSFTMFDNFYKPKADQGGLEFIVYSLQFGYSGQGDFMGECSGKRVILDWKTTNRSRQNPEGISVEYFFQLGGLAQAEYERTGQWVDDLGAVNLSKQGDEPRVVWASDFGMSPQDCAKAYISCFNNYHTIKYWDYKYGKR